MSYSSGYGRSDDGGSSTSMKVDSGSVGKIIGRGGSKIREMEQDCRTRIKISREPDENGQKTVEICGSESDVEKTRQMIDECLAGDYSGGGGGGRRGGFGGGSRGGRSGFGRRDDGDNWGHRDRENGDSYQRRDYDRGGRGGSRGGGGFSSSGGDCETIHVESTEVGRIIGRGGSRIRDMEADSGCRIKVSREGDSRGRSCVELQGSKSAILEAKRLIQEAGVEICNDDDRGRGW
ncbi:hypothetical protein BsWGS_19507 [Bradybaena similaris]